MGYEPTPADIATLLQEVLQVQQQLQPLEHLNIAPEPALLQTLERAGSFADTHLSPLHRSGDEAGCRLQDGTVQTPPGFREAYRAFRDAAWPALACQVADGGQARPLVWSAAIFEMLYAANHGWSMLPAMQQSAYHCLRQTGTTQLQKAYLAGLASGECLATLCLAEARTGLALEQIATVATPQADGSFLLQGRKIFVSGGEHDLSPNILHFVVAREAGAPALAKHLSLFLVPRQLPDGSRNRVVCEGLDDKMGIHGNPTCTLRFDDAKGWRLGPAAHGLHGVFAMVDAVRLQAALQGLGLLEAAWQIAQRHARSLRTGGDAIPTGSEPPAVRRTLDTQRAWIDGGRVLAYQSFVELELAQHHPDPARRARAARWGSPVTPLLKATLTHQAFHGASDCLQVMGSDGYLREWEVEQIVRDARMTMLHAGSNEVQAIDLLVHKVVRDGGAAMGALLADLGAPLDAREPEDSVVLRRFASLQMLTAKLVSASNADPSLPHWVAEDYLRAVALVLMGWSWLRIQHRLRGPARLGGLPLRWAAPAGALRRWILPEFDMRLSIIARRIASDSAPAPLV